MKKEGNLILFFGCFVNGRLKLHQLNLQSPRLKVDEIGRSIHNKLFGFNQKTQKYANQPSMSSKDQSGPKKFGERFRDDGLIGALRKKVSSSKGGPNEMHFLEHLEELRWRLVRSSSVIIVAAIVIFYFTDPIVNHVYLAMSKTDFFSSLFKSLSVSSIIISVSGLGIKTFLST